MCTYISFDFTKSLEELEGTIWESDTISGLVSRCCSLRKKPVKDFSIEDLRLMIGQEIGLEYLIPMAIEELRENIFATGNLYTGDLLKSVVSVNSEFWIENVDLYNEVSLLIKENMDFLTDIANSF